MFSGWKKATIAGMVDFVVCVEPPTTLRAKSHFFNVLSLHTCRSLFHIP